MQRQSATMMIALISLCLFCLRRNLPKRFVYSPLVQNYSFCSAFLSVNCRTGSGPFPTASFRVFWTNWVSDTFFTTTYCHTILSWTAKFLFQYTRKRLKLPAKKKPCTVTISLSSDDEEIVLGSPARTSTSTASSSTCKTSTVAATPAFFEYQ